MQSRMNNNNSIDTTHDFSPSIRYFSLSHNSNLLAFCLITSNKSPSSFVGAKVNLLDSA
jgi:hypothetical protein